MIKTKCDVECYTIDGKETSAMNGARPAVIVTSDPLHRGRIDLQFPNGQTVSVVGSDLQAAIENELLHALRRALNWGSV